MPPTRRRPSPEIRRLLADNVRSRRKSLGLTQFGLARQCGCTGAYIGNIELGTKNVTLAGLEKLALGLRCAVFELLAPSPMFLASAAPGGSSGKRPDAGIDAHGSWPR